MLTKQRVVRSGALLGANEVLSQGLRFVRNIIFARILSPADFGIAATFALAASFLEMITDFGLERMMIQAKDGDDERLGATAQFLLFVRGLLIGLVFFILARPLAIAFKAPEAEFAFQVMAVLPVLSGLTHRDITRLQRHLQFGPSVACKLVPDLVLTAMAWPVAVWIGNYWALLALELGRTCLVLPLSHLTSQRPYRFGWDRAIATRFLSFGWPLLINGFMMYGIVYGDRLIIGLAFNPTELGLYSVAVALAMTPTMTVSSIGGQLLLPMLSQAQDDRPRFERVYRLWMVMLGAIGALLAGGFVLLGPWLIHLLYGSKYAAAGTLIGWLAAAQTIRLLRVGTTSAALALGDTRNSLVANAFRLSGLAMAMGTALCGRPLEWVAAAALIGELVALVMSVVWVRRRHGLAPPICWGPAGIMACVLGLAAIMEHMTAVRSSLVVAALAYLILGMAAIVAILILFNEFRRSCLGYGAAALQSVRSRLGRGSTSRLV